MFNGEKIYNYVMPSLLFSLRAEALKASVDSAIAARQNAYLRRYKNQHDIISKIQLYFNSKPGMLTELATLFSEQATMLTDAYQSDGRTGVVKTTTNTTNSTTVNGGTTTSSTSGTVAGSSGMSTSTTSNSTTSGIPLVPTPNEGPVVQWGETQAYQVGDVVTQFDNSGNLQAPVYQSLGGPELISETVVTPTPTQSSTTSSTNVVVPNTDAYDLTVKTQYDTTNTIKDEVTTNLGYDYRVPIIENKAKEQRFKIGLLDEQLSVFMKSQGVGSLTTLFDNELAMLDASVKRTQSAYVNTLLLAPFAGQITGLFKSPGDYVRSGEPALRLENFEFVYLVGTIIFRGLIETGTTISVTTRRRIRRYDRIADDGHRERLPPSVGAFSLRGGRVGRRDLLPESVRIESDALPVPLELPV